MENVKVSVKIDIKPTNEAAASEAKQSDNGDFSLIIKDGRYSIDRLEQGVLNTTYPAMREALVKALEEAGAEQAEMAKKKMAI